MSRNALKTLISALVLSVERWFVVFAYSIGLISQMVYSPKEHN